MTEDRTTLKMTTVGAPYAEPMAVASVVLRTATCDVGHYTLEVVQALHYDTLPDALAAFADAQEGLCDQPATLLVHELTADELAELDTK